MIRTSRPTLTALTLLLAVVASTPLPGAGQLVGIRTPNLGGAWVGPPRTLQLEYAQRFGDDEAEGGLDDTSAVLIGYGFGGYALAGVRWANTSTLAPDRSDEVEILARLAPLSTAVGAPIDLGLGVAWNTEATSFDVEMTVGTRVGPFKLLGAARGFSDAFGGSDSRWAVGVGGILPVLDLFAVSADLVRPFDLQGEESFGWGAGVDAVVPGTRITIGVHATNTGSPTLQSSSLQATDPRLGVRVGVPLGSAGLFSRRRDPGRRLGQTDLVAGDTVEVAITATGFDPATVAVVPGTFVRWVNRSDAVHSATADDGAWRSPLLAPGDAFGRIFSEPGEHPYASAAAPGHTATIVVRNGR